MDLLKVFAEDCRAVLPNLARPPASDRCLPPFVPSAEGGNLDRPVFRFIPGSLAMEPRAPLPPAAEGAGNGAGPHAPAPPVGTTGADDGAARPFSMSEFTFVTRTLKAGLSSIGALELSREALMLEKAGRSCDHGFIRLRLPGFRNKLEMLVEGAEVAEGAETAGAPDDGAGERPLPLPMLPEAALEPPPAAFPQAQAAAVGRDGLGGVPAGRRGSAGAAGPAVLFEELERLSSALGASEVEAVDAAIPLILTGAGPEGVRREARRLAGLASSSGFAAAPAAARGPVGDGKDG
jgi:hypothetical protein